MAGIALKKIGTFQAEPELQRQLVELERNVEERTAELDRKPDHYDTPRRQSGTITAKFGQFLRLDTTSTVTVHMPRPTPNDAGKTIILRSVTGSGAINIVTLSGQINGASSSSASGSGLTRRVICDGVDYWTW